MSKSFINAKETNTRSRAPNFSNSEKMCLLEIVSNYKNIVENKKTDKVTTQAKNKSWDTIKFDFNSRNMQNFRSVQQLRNLYEQLKKKAKKEQSAKKKSTFQKTQISVVSSKMLEILESLTNTPRVNKYDSCDDHDISQEDESTIISDSEGSDIEYIINDEVAQEGSELSIEYENEIESSSSKPLTDTPIPHYFDKKRLAGRRAYVNVPDTSTNKKQKFDFNNLYENELMDMKRERHKLEIKMLKEQHNLLLDFQRDQKELMNMKREQHAIQMAILNEQKAKFKNETFM